MTLPDVPGSLRNVGNSLSGLSNSANRIGADLGLRLGGAVGASWRARLRPASFRGVEFGVLESQVRFGRKSAIHEYPFRDAVWVEDMGRAGRRYAFVGFLLGDDCIEQRDLLIKACEDPDAALGGGQLVHPTLGRLNVCLDGQVTCVERWDQGRMFELSFSFIEQGQRRFPSFETATQDLVEDAATAAVAAAQSNFLASVVGSLKSGIGAAQQMYSTAQGWANTAQRLVSDATSLVNYVQSLSGNFGRLFGRGTVRSSARTTPVQTLTAQGAVARMSMQQTTDALVASAAALIAATGAPGGSSTSATLTATSVGIDPQVMALTAFAEATLALPATLASVAPTPGDGLRLLGALQATAPAATPGGVSVPMRAPGATLTPAQAIAALASAAASLLRRGSVIGLAQQATTFQPASRDEAQAVMALVVAAIDAEVVIAGDQGDDSSYNALRTLRTAVVQDLTSRAASVAELSTVAMATALPAPALAQRLYRDSTRSDELVQSVDPVHPAFMPASFRALAR